MNTSEWIDSIDKEIKARKQSSERSATTLELYTKSGSISTTENVATLHSSGGSFSSADIERVIVTFDTYSGDNTIATIESTSTYEILPFVRRRNYSGGAQWYLVAPPDTTGGSWQTTTHNITVHSMVDGTLTLSEIR